ncbi:unnamed protein product, partial [Mesorhabditis spiculigera]
MQALGTLAAKIKKHVDSARTGRAEKHYDEVQQGPLQQNSTLKRRIARSQSERKLKLQDVSDEPPPDYPLDYELSEVSWNPEGQDYGHYEASKRHSYRRSRSAPTNYENILQNIDPRKLAAVIQFMEVNEIDPYLPMENQHRVESLRRAASIDHLEVAVHYDQPFPRKLRRTRNSFQEKNHFHRSSLQDLRFFERKQEVEYGPGIVERLRAKFTKLSGLATKNAKVSPHATCKRCPSVDDILLDKEAQAPKERAYVTLDRNWGEPEKPQYVPEPQQIRPRMNRGSSADPEKRYVVHREIKRDLEEEDDVQLPSISFLRRKFEENAGRTNWENRQSYKTPVDMAVVRSQSAERSRSPSIASPTPVATPEPTFERPYRVLSPQNQPHPPAKVHSPRKAFGPATKEEHREKPRPRSMDVAHEKALLGKDFYPPRLRLSQPQRNKLWVLEVLNRAEDEQENVDRHRVMPRSATTGEIHERSASPSQPVFMPPVRRAAPVLPELSSGARVLLSQTAHPPPSSTIHVSHTHHRPTSDFRMETTTFEYKSDAKKVESREKPEPRAQEREIFISPPDPDSARDDRPAAFSPSQAPVIQSADVSPPPEEPKPPVQISRLRTQPATYAGPKILPRNNDASGKEEMKRMLSKFNASRDKKLFDEPNNEVPKHDRVHTTAPATTTTGHTIHTTVIQTYEPIPPKGDLSATTSFLPTRSTQPRVMHPHQYQNSANNVTNITVRTDSPAPPNTAHNQDGSPSVQPKDETPIRRPAPPPPASPIQEYRVEPTPEPVPTSQVRKSFSAQFLEQQAQKTHTSPTPTSPLVSPKPYGDDATIRVESEDEGTEVSEAGDMEYDVEAEAKRARTSTVDSAVSIGSTPSEYSIEEEPAGTRAKYTFALHHQFDDGDEPEADFDADSIDEASGKALESEEEVPNVEAIERHLNETEFEVMQSEIPEESESDSDDEPPPLTLLNGFSTQNIPLMAGDGNPVRNSLISLVMEEDIPMLLEAMSENPRFEFVDLNENQPSTSSILHPAETRIRRRIERKVGRIAFVETTPEVYTYLDEKSAEKEINWVDGCHINYKVYQTIVTAEQEEQNRQYEELERWRRNVENDEQAVDCPPNSTNHLGYSSSITETSKISV